MSAAFTFTTPSLRRCSTARSHRILPCSSTRRWIASSSGVLSGIALAVLVQLTSDTASARAADEMVVVPRGALEELLLRDLSSRIHEMDSKSLASFMQNLKVLSAPDPGASSSSELSDTATGKAPAGRPSDSGTAPAVSTPETPRPQPDPPAAAAAPAAAAPAAAAPAAAAPAAAASAAATPAAARPDPESKAGNKGADASAASAKPPAEPTYSIFRDAGSAPISSQLQDDQTALLLGLRASRDPPRPEPRNDVAVRASDPPDDAWSSVLGLPLAVWTKLDQILPADLRATSGEPLTEEVQRAVYVVKGLVLVASSALAYFLSRALLYKLAQIALGFPLVRQALTAAETATAAARQATPELQQRASDLLSRLPGRSAKLQGSAARVPEGPRGEGDAESGDAGMSRAAAVQGAVRDTAQRDAGRENARGAGAMPRLEASRQQGAAGGAPPPPPLLVPTAQAALYTGGQTRRGSAGAVPRPPREAGVREPATSTDGLDVVREAGVTAEPRLVSSDTGGAQDVQSGMRNDLGSGTTGAGGPGVLWRRGGKGSSLLSDRWAGAASATAAVDGSESHRVAGQNRDSGDPAIDEATDEGGLRTSGIGTMSNGDGGGVSAADEALQMRGNGSRPYEVAYGQAGVDKKPQLDSDALGHVSHQSGAGKDPWLG
eukprot:jgi/Ulvmu1/7673/UM038_0102.1